MTNETNRTKIKVSGIGKRGIAIVLCFVMLLTAIGSGSVLNAIAVEGNGASVLLDAAKAGADVDAPADAAAADDKADAAAEDEAPLAKKADSDLAVTGRDADVAETGDTTYYLWLAKNGGGNWEGGYTSQGTMTASGSNYTSSFTINNNSNFAFCISTSSSDKWSGIVSFANTSNITVSSDFNPVHFQNLNHDNTNYNNHFVETNFKNNNSDTTVYVTFNPATPTVSISTTSSGSGGGSSSETWTVTGSSATIFGEAWDQDRSANDMTLVSENTYVKVFTGVTDVNGFSFKINKNHAWDTAYPSSNFVVSHVDTTTTRSISATTEESGDLYWNSGDTITFTFDSETHEISITSETPETTHDVTFSAGSNGSISPTAGTHAVGEVTETTVTASPNTGYTVDSWTIGDGIIVTEGTTTGSNQSSTIKIKTKSSGTYTVQANFTAKPTYPITVTSNNAAYGTASASPAYAYEGQTVTLTATENTGTFSSWSVVSGDASISGNTKTATFTMPDNAVKVKAMFNAYSGTSKYYYDGWKNESAVSPGDGWNNVQMTEALYNGQKYAYFHATTARPSDSSDNKFSISYRESGDRYVYFWDNRDRDSSWANNPVAVFEDATGGQIASMDAIYVSGSDNNSHHWKFKIPQSSDTSSFNRVARVYFTNGKTDGWQRTEGQYIWASNGCFSRGDKSANDNTWYLLQYDGTTSESDSDGNRLYYWGSPSDTDQTYESDPSTARFGSDIVLSYADIGNYTNDISMVKPVNAPTDYYIIVYYPNTNYGTINGVAANNTNAYPIVVASTDLPGGSVDTVKVYAKDGAIRPGYTTYARLGDTKIYDEDGLAVGDPVNDANGDGYETYTATKGETITIKTTINDNYGVTTSPAQKYSDQYYVRGFLVNGEVPKNTLNTTGKTANNVYELEYTIPEDFEGKYIEITPVYYLVDTVNNQTVTFYVDNFTPELQAISDNGPNWGDTIYAYPFYSTLGGTNNAFGQYPGQPLIFYNGRYSVQIPIYDTSPFPIYTGSPDNTILTSGTDSGKLTQRRAIRISGITLHNGYYDTVHRTVMEYKHNGDGGSYQYRYQTQTYDFDDFYKIYHEKDDVDNIVFQFKYKDHPSGTSNDNLSKLSGFTTTPADAAAITDQFGGASDFEDLLNFHKRKVNIYGDALSGSSLSNNPVYVVSKAGASSVENTVGHYATEWVIYTPSAKTGAASYTMVSGGGKNSIPPSLLLLNSEDSFSNTMYPSAVSGYNTTDWKTYYKALANYKDCPVKITYEEAKYDVSGDKATRSDGRWLYSKNGENITSNIRIDVNTSYSDGTYVTNGTGGVNISGLSAYFTNPEASGQTTYATTIDPDKTFDFTAVTSNPDYIFEGWYLDNGTPVTKDNSGKAERSANYTLVARFRHHTSGILMINHTRGSDDNNFKGNGATKMTVTVVDGDGVVVRKDENVSEVTLPDSIIKTDNSLYTIKVTLTANPSGDDKFEKVILSNKNADGSTNSNITGTFFDGSMTYTTMPGEFTFRIGDLFSSNTQNVKLLSYISYFSAPVYTYQIKYQYTSKLNDGNGSRAIQTFTKKGTMTPAEGSTYVTKDGDSRILSTEFINKIAPWEENYGETKTWTIPESTYRTFTETSSNNYSLNMTTGAYIVTSVVSSVSTVKSITYELPYKYNSEGGVKFEGNEDTPSAYAEGASPYVTTSKNFVLSVPYGKVPKPRYNTLSDKMVQRADEVEEVDDDLYVVAPDTLDKSSSDDTKLYFQYWRVYSNKDSKEVARCYTTKFTFAALGDYTITPIYEETNDPNHQNPSEGMAATINYLGASRNQWNYEGWGNAAMIGDKDTEAQTASDLLFQDFVCAYYYHGEKIHTGDNKNLQTGYVVDRIDYLETFDGTTVTQDNRATTLTKANTNTSCEQYETKYASSLATDKANIERYLTGQATKPANISIVNFNSTSLDNKDRIQNFYSVYNSVGWDQDDETPDKNYAYKYFVYRAFAYIKDSTGNVSLSEPVYFTMYDIAMQKEG